MKTLLVVSMWFSAIFFANAQQLASNATYRVAADFPRYVTAHIEFRDPTGVRWPSFFYGKPSTNGFVRLNTQPAATLTFVLNERPQKNGDQSRRILGELFSTTNSGAIVLHVNGLTSMNTSSKGTFGGTVAGVVEVAGNKVSFNAPATFRPHAGKGDEKNEALMVELSFETKASALGLKATDAAAVVQVRAAFTAYSDASIAAATARGRPRS